MQSAQHDARGRLNMPRTAPRQYPGLFELVHRLLDWCVIGLVAWLAHWAYLGAWILPAAYQTAIAVAIVMSAWMFPNLSVYEPWRGASMLEEIRRVTIAWCALLMLLFVFAVATKSSQDFSRIWMALWAVIGWLGLVVVRVVLRLFVGWAHRVGYNVQRVAIAGSADLAAQIARRIAAAPWAGLRVEGLFTDDPVAAQAAGLPVLGRLGELAGHLEKSGIDQVWIAMALKEEARVRSLLHDLRHATVDIKFVPDIYGFRLINHSVSEIAGLAVLNLSSTPMSGANRMVKAVEDKVLAVLFLLLFGPLMLLIMIGVKLSSPGPVFYRQTRVGWNGRPFMMLKFRSMPVDTEADSGPVWARKGEKRATRFGAFLRRTSLDELPQFLNVIRGDMSIVGPRPERPVFVEKFKDEVPDYMKKHLVKAGITGWAQVNGWRGDTDLAKRIEYDLYYIEHWSIWFDLGIILLTPLRGLINRNAY